MPSSGSREGVHWAAMKTIEELEELNHQLQVELRKARAAQAQAEAANQNKGSVVILGGLIFVNFPLCIHLC